MGVVSWWLRLIAFLSIGASMLGCASAQLNYNALDIASTVDSLVTSQVLSNLAKFLDSPNAIPSQIVIPAGTVQTNNSISSSTSIPINVLSTATNTIATTVAAAASKTNTNTTTMNNTGETLAANDGWTQTWNVSPVTDPDQIRRLRILYQYATDQADDTDLLCNYPMISKKQDTSSQTAASGQPNPTAITYTTDKGAPVTVHFGTPKASPKSVTKYWVNCTHHSEMDRAAKYEPVATNKLQTHTVYLGFTNIDPTFLQPPSCVLCDDPSFSESHESKCNTKGDDFKNFKKTTKTARSSERDDEANENDVCLYINRRLTQNWLQYKTSFLEIPPDAIYLGHYQREHVGLVRQEYYFYVLGRSKEETLYYLNCFYEFSLFVLEATATNATSSTPIFIAGTVPAR